VKRFSLTVLNTDRILLIYAASPHDAAVKASRAGHACGEIKPAGEWDALLGVISERAHVNGKANGHANGHHQNGAGHR
jgi:hypothetical protein